VNILQVVDHAAIKNQTSLWLIQYNPVVIIFSCLHNSFFILHIRYKAQICAFGFPDFSQDGEVGAGLPGGNDSPFTDS